ncbi:enoyl-CoA hydratase-related protein [Chloroflexota bacterium]
MGPKRLREWLLTGRIVTAQEAKEWGWVNAVVPDADLEKETMRWAETVCLMPADGLVNGKIHYMTVLDTMGYAAAQEASLTAWVLMQNLRWDEDEMNFLKVRSAIGPTQAFKEREKRWAELGF